MNQLIPSPSLSSFSVGPLTIHIYALCIITGIAAAIWIGRKRYANLGGNPDDVSEVAIWAVPFGIIGGRIYHVITSPSQYFGSNGNPIDALRIWEGGLGIWGAISLGAVGAYLYFRTHKTSLNFRQLLDSLAPGVIVAQAIGRIGNYFNQEVFGKPTELPWGLEIDSVNRPNGFESYSTFHPTFLYELVWCLVVAVLLIKLPGFLKKITARQGDVFALYVFGYTAGRVWIETLRIDEANLILGLRLNIWVSFIVLITACAYLIASKRRGNTKENHITS
ncbi:MAG: prolipoprotein diacylglyceryl transferase [Actinobacteria bacterium]|jgi:prolipoprotein diacylglyceryl transferase|nr:prolipoprotein diacylglyceryl transferase [Actinomycetota bacterium]